MKKICSIEGCENKVAAKGMCSKHYQRDRRKDTPSTGKVGRPRQYPKELTDKFQGAPMMSVRMRPELLAWVKERGGATWVRYVAGELKELAEDPAFKEWQERFRLDKPSDSE